MIESAPCGVLNPFLRKAHESYRRCCCYSNARVAIAIARFNNFINDSLLEGAIDALKRIGQVADDNITVVWVPGAYELPLTASVLAKTGKYDGYRAGHRYPWGTAHFEYVAGEASSGIGNALAMNARNPGCFWRADHRKHRAGDRTRRHQSG